MDRSSEVSASSTSRSLPALKATPSLVRKGQKHYTITESGVVVKELKRSNSVDPIVATRNLGPTPTHKQASTPGPQQPGTATHSKKGVLSLNRNTLSLQQNLVTSGVAEFLASNGDEESELSQQLGKWQGQMERDAKTYNSVATWAEVTLRRVQSDTMKEPKPNPLRTAVACMVLDRITSVCGPYADLLRRLHEELFASIFIGWEEYLERKPVALRKVLAEHGGQNEYDVSAQKALGPTSSVITASNLNLRETYFQALADLQVSRTQVIGAPARVLASVLQLWRRRLLGLHFRAWKGLFERRWALLRKAEKQIASKLLLRGGKTKLAHFAAWRTYVFERRHQCRVVYEESNRVKLVNRMGRRIQALEEENAMIKKRYESLFTEYCDVSDKITTLDDTWSKFQDWVQESNKKNKELTAEEIAERNLRIEQEAATKTLQEQNSEKEAEQRMAVEAKKEEEQKEKERESADEAALRLVDTAVAEAQSEVEDRGVANVQDAGNVDDVKNEASHGRVAQLKQFLNLEPGESVTDFQDPNQQNTTKSKETKRVKHSLPEQTINYKTVLEWVASRVQLFLTDTAVLKRCSNFTTDFRDCTRLAYLLVSLGADRNLVDEVFACKSTMDRALCVCREAEIFGCPKPLEPAEIVKMKGARIAAFLFFLYEHYGNRPLVLPKSAVNPRLVVALGESASMSHASGSPKASQAGSPLLSQSGMQMSMSAAAMDDDDDDEPLPDSQFIIWYKELAAEDSDVEEVDEYFDEMEKRQTTIQDVAVRLANRLKKAEEINFIPEELTEEKKNQPGILAKKKKKATQQTPKASVEEMQRKQAAKAKRKIVESNRQLFKWVAEKLHLPAQQPQSSDQPAPPPINTAPDSLSATNSPTVPRQGPFPTAASSSPTEGNTAASSSDPITASLLSMSNSDLLRRICEEIQPVGPQSPRGARAEASPAIKAKVLEKQLNNLRLSNLRVKKANSTTHEDSVVSLKQVLTALYVMNQKNATLLV